MIVQSLINEELFMKKNIFVVVRSLVKQGGLSKYVIDLYTRMHQENHNFNIHFVLQNSQNDYGRFLYDQGIMVHYITPLQQAPLKYFRDWDSLFHIYKIDVIHFHVDNLVLFYPIKKAQKERIPMIIVQSHNACNEAVNNSKVKMFLHNYAKKRINNWTGNLYAVSKEAAIWLYGKNLLNKVKLIKNPVDTSLFSYSQQVKEKYKNKFNLRDKIVYGHVGRFVNQKNHEFLIDVFKKILKRQPNAELVLVGNGPLQNKIKNYVYKNKISEHVLFLGRREDVPSLMSLFNCMIFPSLYEGFPLVLVEAQSTGLPIVCSDSISSNIKILLTTHQLSLKTDKEEWANLAIESSKVTDTQRSLARKKLIDVGYDYETQVKKMAYVYSCKGHK